MNPEQNPLLNHVVLERIFQLVEFDPKNFATYRLVCKQWMKTSLSKWRKNSWLPVTTSHQHNGVYVGDYLKLLKSPEHRLTEVPFRKYIISNWCGAINDSEHHEEIPERLEFWKTVGPLMTHLSIQSTQFDFNRTLCNIIFVYTPNLEYLELSKNHYMTHDHLDPQRNEHKYLFTASNRNLTQLKINLEYCVETPTTWMIDIITHFPNIRIFELLHSEPRSATWTFNWMLKGLEIVRKNKGPFYLKDLSELHLLNLKENRRNKFTLQFASVLTGLKFPLKVLALDVGCELDIEHAKEALKTVLEGHAEKLQELNLAREVETFPFPDFPFGIQFPNLVKFTTTGKLVQNLEFLKEMPNLEFLQLEQDSEEIRINENFCNDSVVLEKMKQFKITNKFLSKNQLRTLGKLMPNLINITLGLKTSSGLKMACSIWKKLIHIKIYTATSDEDELWKSEDADKYIRKIIYDLKDMKSLKIGDLIEYPK